MDFSIQITLDCADPHRQAAWWAQTLGWVVEPADPEFIRKMVDEGHAVQEDTRVFEGQLVWKTGAGICPADQVSNVKRQRMLLQWVPEPKTAKNRMHLDLHSDIEKEVVREALLARGAVFLYEFAQGPFAWFTMADPEGNEFCIS